MDDFSLPFSSSLSCDFSSGSPSVSGSYSGDCLFQADENEILAHEIGYWSSTHTPTRSAAHLQWHVKMIESDPSTIDWPINLVIKYEW